MNDYKLSILFLLQKVRINKQGKCPIRCRVTYLKTRKIFVGFPKKGEVYNKSNYIDSFLSRNVNAFYFSKGLANAINGDSNYPWFLK